MNFEWDEEKRIANFQKHGIDFADVWRMFDYDFFFNQLMTGSTTAKFDFYHWVYSLVS